MQLLRGVELHFLGCNESITKSSLLLRRMQIVVNSIYPQGHFPDNASFAGDFFGYLAGQHPDHHFYFLTNQESNQYYTAATNATIVPINNTLNNIASLQFWNNVQLALLLKKLQTTVLVQPFGFCCRTTNVPQVLMVSDLLWMNKQPYFSKTIRTYHRLFGKQGIKKAAHIITFSDFIKQALINQYPNALDKVAVFSAAASYFFQPITIEQKQQVKDSYADGREYFLFTGGNNPKNNLIGLLKAFSLFKKWQKSNMKLLIAGHITQQKGDVLKKLSSYKYKDDVVVLKEIDEQQLTLITAAAYTFIFPSLYEGFTTPMLSAMQCGVPVVASRLSTATEIGGEGCLYAAVNDVEDLANQLKLLYRDELLRASLIEKGLQQAAIYNWERTAGLFWDGLLKVIS